MKLTEEQIMKFCSVRLFDDSLLRKIKSLPNSRLQANGQSLIAAHLVFDGGDGFLMPIRDLTV